MTNMRFTARVVYRNDRLVCFDLYGHGPVGDRSRIGFIATTPGAETDDLLEKLYVGGWVIVDAGDLLELGVIPELSDV